MLKTASAASRLCRRLSNRSGHRLTCRAIGSSQPPVDNDQFFKGVARIEVPKRLNGFLKTLQQQGNTLVSPADRSGFHPFFIPLVRGDFTDPGDSSIAAAEVYTGLLRWPNTAHRAAMPLPVVSMSRGARGVRLLARSIDEYLHRALVEEDQKDVEGRPLATAAGSEGAELYAQGDLEKAGLGPRLDLYLIRKAGMYPDVCESLALGHLKRGDTTSALVTAEWYIRSNHFPGWARPFEFSADIFQSLGRKEEARDTARMALRHPWWSLKQGFGAVQLLAQLKGSPEAVRFQLSEEGAAAAAAVGAGSQVKVSDDRTPEQKAEEDANQLLDYVAGGSIATWDDVRADLAKCYVRARLPDMAHFVVSA